MLDAGYFFGKGFLAGQTQRIATATAMAQSTILAEAARTYAAAPTLRRCSSAHAAECHTINGEMRGGCDLRPTSVEESAATEQQHHEEDDEQSSRVHFLVSYSSRVIRIDQYASNTNQRLCT